MKRMRRITSVGWVAMGILFFTLSAAFAFPPDNPDRWKYVTAEGIPVTLEYQTESATFIAEPEARRDAVRALPPEVALPMIADEQGFGRETALRYYYPDTMEAIDLWLMRNVERTPVDARAEIGDDRTAWKIVPGKVGTEVDRTALTEDLYRTLLQGGGAVRIVAREALPETTRAKLYRETVYRGGYETSIEASTAARRHNVRLALSRFNGLRVESGQTVSFNEVVGARTAENGYETAKVIYMGEYVDGVGGGVCQASTTLYNAVVLSGLTVRTVCQHSLAPSYVSPGRDAMVNDAGADFIFQNQTGAPVRIRVFDSDERVRVEIYGTEQTVRYRLETKEIAAIPAEWTRRQDDGKYADRLCGREEYVVRTPVDGVQTETYLHALSSDGAETVSLVRRNRYAPIGGLIVTK